MNAAFNGPKRARLGVSKGGHGASSFCGMSMISNDTAANKDDPETSTIRQLHGQNGYNSESGFESLDPIEEGLYDGASDSHNGEEILLNVSPHKYEKPKDQLFINFFGMYTKKFVEEQGPQTARTRQAAQRQI